MNYSFMKIVNFFKFKMCESFNFINILLFWWIGCLLFIREYIVICLLKEELEITVGFWGYYFILKYYWLFVGSLYIIWVKKFWF